MGGLPSVWFLAECNAADHLIAHASGRCSRLNGPTTCDVPRAVCCLEDHDVRLCGVCVDVQLDDPGGCYCGLLGNQDCRGEDPATGVGKGSGTGG